MIKGLMVSILLIFSAGCLDGKALAKASFEKGDQSFAPKAGLADVISMGRDDDDGNASKWHIGGAEE